MYKLVDAKEENIKLLINYKLSTIYEYACELDNDEVKRIEDYVNSSVLEMLNVYKVIEVKGKKCGSLLLTDYNEGILIDEIYLEKEYRNKGIGSSILENIVNKHDVVYLWVYKENKGAINLYKRFGFEVIEETETRYFMKYVN